MEFSFQGRDFRALQLIGEVVGWIPGVCLVVIVGRDIARCCRCEGGGGGARETGFGKGVGVDTVSV